MGGLPSSSLGLGGIRLEYAWHARAFLGLGLLYGNKLVSATDRTDSLGDVRYDYHYLDRRAFVSGRFLAPLRFPLFLSVFVGRASGAKVDVRESALTAPLGLESGRPREVYVERSVIETQGSWYAGFSVGVIWQFWEHLGLSAEIGYANDTLERGKVRRITVLSATTLPHQGLDTDLRRLLVTAERRRLFFRNRSTGVLHALVWVEYGLW